MENTVFSGMCDFTEFFAYRLAASISNCSRQQTENEIFIRDTLTFNINSVAQIYTVYVYNLNHIHAVRNKKI